MKKTGFYGYVYGFSVDYDAIAVYGFSVDYDAIADAIRHSQVFNEKSWYKIMFRFIKKLFITAIGFTGLIATAIPVKYVLTSNQECKARPTMINININKPLFYPYGVLSSNVVILIIHVLDYALPMLLTTWISN